MYIYIYIMVNTPRISQTCQHKPNYIARHALRWSIREVKHYMHVCEKRINDRVYIHIVFVFLLFCFFMWFSSFQFWCQLNLHVFNFFASRKPGVSRLTWQSRFKSICSRLVDGGAQRPKTAKTFEKTKKWFSQFSRWKSRKNYKNMKINKEG